MRLAPLKQRVAAGGLGSNVDHLEELRSRLIVVLAAIGVAFVLCMTQNQALLRFVGRPLAGVAAGSGRAAESASETAGATVARDLTQLTGALLAPHSGAGRPLRTTALALRPSLRRAEAASARPPDTRPVTLGVGEPLTTSLTVALLFAFVLTLPVLLQQLYGFLSPALAPERRRALRRLFLTAPLLFLTGAAFGYLVVLPATLHFLLTFNSGEFTVLVQAGQYYRFAALTVVALGVVFELPVAIVALTTCGVVSAATLRKNRRYAVVGCVAVAAMLPGEVVTMALETVPLYLLFELGVLAAAFGERRAAQVDAGAATARMGG